MQSLKKALRQLAAGLVGVVAVAGLGYLADPAAVSKAMEGVPPEWSSPVVLLIGAIASALLDLYRHRAVK